MSFTQRSLVLDLLEEASGLFCYAGLVYPCISPPRPSFTTWHNALKKSMEQTPFPCARFCWGILITRLPSKNKGQSKHISAVLDNAIAPISHRTFKPKNTHVVQPREWDIVPTMWSCDYELLTPTIPPPLPPGALKGGELEEEEKSCEKGSCKQMFVAF